MGEKKDLTCPKCGKRMPLVAAGYYCMKDDYLVDPLTGKPYVKPDYFAGIVGERERVDIFFDRNHIVMKEASRGTLYDIAVEDIDEVEVGRIERSSFGDEAIGFLVFGILGAALAASDNLPTLRIAYLTKTGMKTSITLAMSNAAELARKIDSLRVSLQLPLTTKQKEQREQKTVKEKEIIREKEIIIKIRCRCCSNVFDESLDKCPHCGGRR